MYSQEFMKYLLKYQMEESKPKEKSTVKEVRFNSRKGGKLAEILLTINNK